jgi:hypothetical protein
VFAFSSRRCVRSSKHGNFDGSLMLRYASSTKRLSIWAQRHSTQRQLWTLILLPNCQLIDRLILWWHTVVASYKQLVADVCPELSISTPTNFMPWAIILLSFGGTVPQIPIQQNPYVSVIHLGWLLIINNVVPLLGQTQAPHPQIQIHSHQSKGFHKTVSPDRAAWSPNLPYPQQTDRAKRIDVRMCPSQCWWTLQHCQIPE